MTAAILSGSTKAGVASHRSRSGNSLSPDSCHTFFPPQFRQPFSEFTHMLPPLIKVPAYSSLLQNIVFSIPYSQKKGTQRFFACLFSLNSAVRQTKISQSQYFLHYHPYTILQLLFFQTANGSCGTLPQEKRRPYNSARLPAHPIHLLRTQAFHISFSI